MSEEEEDPVDPKGPESERCTKTAACAKMLVVYEQCAERIESKGAGHCSGQYMDYIACVDSCVRLTVASNLFFLSTPFSLWLLTSTRSALCRLTQAKQAIFDKLK